QDSMGGGDTGATGVTGDTGGGAAACDRSAWRPSFHSDSASSTAPHVTAESATLKVGKCQVPNVKSRKSTTPCGERMRSTRLPAAPALMSASEYRRTPSPARVARSMEPSTTRAAIETTTKTQRATG